MLEKLTSDDIRQACGGASYHRGLDYYRQGMVQEVKVLPLSNSVEVHSIVSGGFRDAYKVSISLARRGGELNIDGDCECPVGFNCKHVAATLVEVVENEISLSGESQQDEVLGWLDALASADEEDAAEVEATPGQTFYRLVYQLEPEPASDDPYRVSVVTLRAKLLKNGEYGKPAGYALEKLSTSEFFIQQADKDIAKILVTPRPYYFTGYENRYALKGELGELAVQKMLQTGQCYWKSLEDGALRKGPKREMGFRWEDVKGGKTLSADLGDNTQLMELSKLFYVDVEQGLVGPVTHPSLSTRQLKQALAAPVIPEERLEEVSRHLKVDLPDSALPAPVALELDEKDIDTPPTPVLTLVSAPAAAGYGKRLMQHHARLGFRYGEVEVSGLGQEEQTQHLEGNTLYRVKRRLQDEHDAVEHLSNFGLHPHGAGGGRETLMVFPEGSDEAMTAWMWHEFLEETIPELESEGWQVKRDESFALRVEEVDDWEASLEEEGHQWFSLSLGVRMDGLEVNLLPLLVDILSQVGSTEELYRRLDAERHFLLPAGADRWIKVPSDRLRPIFDTLVELYSQQPLRDDGKLLLSPYQGIQLGDLLNDPRLKWHGAEDLQELQRKLAAFEKIEEVDVPEGFTAELRGYQKHGLSWLQFLREYQFNGILADDMGLGKTVQTLAHLLLEKKSGRATAPNLIVVPTSLLGNWKREAHEFAPELKVLLLHGADRHREFARIPDHDLVVTTYPLLRRDKDVLLKQAFHFVVLDEAQSIKNPKSQTAQTVFQLEANHRLCLSGTPMENHLGELWSIFHFLMPGFLGTQKQFNQLFRYPIERQGDGLRQEQLRKRLSPFMLRRTKAEVVKELPEKNEIIRNIILEDQQRDLYESIRLAMDSKVRAEIKKKGLARSHIMILDALLKLRQVCCDPRLVSMPQAANVDKSAKLELLMDMVPEMVQEGRKILIFSQFTKMLSLIETEMDNAGIAYTKLTGQTRKRDEAIEKFQSGDVPVFLVSLKAGGVGLNLTAADTVIHYDPWWNPAAENQATDRAHRIGQDKVVFVYKLITEGTVEEKIVAMQERKQSLADAVYSGKDSQSGNFSSEELIGLLSEM